MLALGLFLPLVLTALTVSWHNSDIRNLGLALFLSWAVSNVTAVFLPFEYRPVIYPVLEVLIGLLAAGAWLVMRFTPGRSSSSEGQTFAMAVVTCALVSTAACVNYSLVTSPGYGDKYLFVLVTNICFAVECLLVTWWGIRDALRRATGIARFIQPPVRHLAQTTDGARSRDK